MVDPKHSRDLLYSFRIQYLDTFEQRAITDVSMNVVDGPHRETSSFELTAQ
jgi:hypothetical protein